MKDTTKRCDLVFGQSASGKTTWALRLAAQVWKDSRKKTRWYLGDGGGETITNMGVEEFVEVVQYPLWPHPFQTTTRVCEGWWPQDPTDPTSKWLPPPANLGETYGMFVVEGLTVMSDYLMGNKPGGLASLMAEGKALNKDESFRIQDGDIKLGGNARTHYGIVQRRMQELIDLSRYALPRFVLWTAHERRAEDPEYKDVMFGPDVCGQALTTKIGASFGNTVHLVAVPIKGKGQDPATKKQVETITMAYRAYTRKHFDPEGSNFVKFYANTRIPDPALMPEYLEPADPLRYYALLEEAKRKTQETLMQV